MTRYPYVAFRGSMYAVIAANAHMFGCFAGEEPTLTRRHYTESATPDPAKRYASDLDDAEWQRIAPLVAQKDGSGKKRTVNIREILNTLFYRTRTGCQWRMFPKDLSPWYHAWY